MTETIDAPRTEAPRKKRLYTGQDLLNHPEWGNCELIRGKVVSVCRPNYKHGKLTNLVAFNLTGFVLPRNLGDVIVGDSGVYLERDPDTVRGPDIYYISAARQPVKDATDGYLEVAPELCVEVISPKDRWTKIRNKVRQFLEIGVKLVWVIDPKLREAHVYRADGTVARMGAEGLLSGEDVLPGFELPLKELFAVLE